MPTWKRALISGFVLFNIVAVLCSSSKPVQEQNPLERFFMPYLRWTRLNQRWPLFVPSPRKFALKFRVEIQFKDGTQKVWRRPYPPNWDFFARHLAYSFQKWDLASNYLDAPGPLWLDLVHFIEWLYREEPSPPQKIILIRSMGNWPEPAESGDPRQDENLLQWVDTTVFAYDVVNQRFER